MKPPKLPLLCLLALRFVLSHAVAEDRFAQLGDLLPPPSEARLASGAPGPAYWQQEANYEIEVELDEESSMIRGSETIEYVNHSPHDLPYLWVQLDQNLFAKDSQGGMSAQPLQLDRKAESPPEVTFRTFRNLLYQREFEGGYRLGSVTDESGEAIPYQIVNTNMRIDLPEPLRSGESIRFKVDWEFPIVEEANAVRYGRKELEGGGFAYHIAQWYPRMCAYYDRAGWQVKPYIGSGEFALEFGSFEVAITAPKDFVLAATGSLLNADEVLSDAQRERLATVASSGAPVLIVTEEEAAAKLANPSSGTKTWRYKAERVRDFAFAASRGYIWDAKTVGIDGESVMAASVYPKEAAALWGRYSTEAIAQTLRVYSDVVYPYPYPVAWSAWGPTYGMEYPMVSFQSSMDIDEEGTYPEKVRNYVIGVVVHEVGHNWFPMILNSDERQWMWLDEGLNTFVEGMATASFDPQMAEEYREDFEWTVKLMASSDDPAIMMSADSQPRRGFQAYRKPALGLTLLRESLLGPELFDFAFKEYARRWAFKRATPADFFRTMEDASGIDLDWFWRGWFFGSDHVDVSVESVEVFALDDGHPERSKEFDKNEREAIPDTPFLSRLRKGTFVSDASEHLQDWYYSYDEFAATEKEIEEYQKMLEELEDWQKELLEFDRQIYIATIKNIGGLPMPLILDVAFENGSKRRISLPVEIWRFGDEEVHFPIIAEQAVVRVEVDRDNAFADANLDNNVFPREIEKGRFRLKADEKEENPMREALYPEEEDEEQSEEEKDGETED